MFSFGKKSKKSKAAEPLELSVTPSRPDAAVGASEASAPAPRKRRRANNNKTRLMGLDSSDGRVVDLFGEDKATDESARIHFPVALIMIIKGPGLGECFAIKSGMSQIGRGEDQSIRLDFGDAAISRSNHAAIVYDPGEHSYLLGHGGKSNIVRLNGKPVVSTSDLKNGDEIEIGVTTMRFVALCSKEFNWEEAIKDGEGSDENDMEIA